MDATEKGIREWFYSQEMIDLSDGELILRARFKFLLNIIDGLREEAMHLEERRVLAVNDMDGRILSVKDELDSLRAENEELQIDSDALYEAMQEMDGLEEFVEAIKEDRGKDE